MLTPFCCGKFVFCNVKYTQSALRSQLYFKAGRHIIAAVYPRLSTTASVGRRPPRRGVLAGAVAWHFQGARALAARFSSSPGTVGSNRRHAAVPALVTRPCPPDAVDARLTACLGNLWKTARPTLTFCLLLRIAGPPMGNLPQGTTQPGSCLLRDAPQFARGWDMMSANRGFPRAKHPCFRGRCRV